MPNIYPTDVITRPRKKPNWPRMILVLVAIVLSDLSLDPKKLKLASKN